MGKFTLVKQLLIVLTWHTIVEVSRSPFEKIMLINLLFLLNKNYNLAGLIFIIFYLRNYVKNCDYFYINFTTNPNNAVQP